jgi:hypothetical protein
VLTTWWFSFGFLYHAVAKCSTISEECTVSIFRVSELVWLDTKVTGEKKKILSFTQDDWRQLGKSQPQNEERRDDIFVSQ